ncbi:MAG: hypothetical protein DYG93_07945 [Leptolyngbya sp. PLA2]|nr:hypothetical protein [Leptolyngbya sp.]MCE7971579.1 hypothetical protein [Leptolyngbya sp. PL-A2]MCZ7632615.1 hypothetical protein [Phycisphaerales bacterium]MDL1904932.1 hypothetical protein [Synechococcales cyanobacterium CNB]GIK19830.1 MAG: hypothetical protein BroJett004_19940 [Planctomycetota bacterium]
MSTSIAGAGAIRTSPTGGAGLTALSPEQFFKVIFTELANQDPLQPNDTTALLQQLSTIRSIQSDMDLSDRMGQLVTQNEFVSGASLIGRHVSGLSESGSRVQGIVRSASRTDSGVVLKLDNGERVPVKRLDEVLAESHEEAAA